MASATRVVRVAPDWAFLPSEIVIYISKSLTFFDYLAFRSVCRSWADAMRGVRPSLHAPYLLLAGADSEYSERFTFLNIADNISYRRTIPGLHGKNCVGSQHGWLALEDAEELTLLNPVTGKVIRLPPTTNLPFIWDTSETLFFKVVLSANPSTAREFTIAALIGRYRRFLVFTRSKEHKWHIYKDERFKDLLFRDGALFGMDICGYLRSIQLDGPNIKSKVLVKQFRAEVKATGKYLAVDEVGQLMFVWRVPKFFPLATTHIEVHRLHSEKMRWVRAKKLDSHALFIGRGMSMLLSAQEALGVKANHIYFTHDWDWNKTEQHDTGLFSLEDNSVQPCHGPDKHFEKPRPIWFTPELPQTGSAIIMDLH